MVDRNMTQRACIYARYSSDLQSDASIEDQIRLCSDKASAEGWKLGNCYTDAGISGASLMRPGIQSLLSGAMNGEFDILIAEALDRLSRDQEDIAGIFKRMEFAGVKIITLSEGEISTLHIGLKGTMNAMFLKDLADKTRRGLRGRVEKGKSGGGLAYGYQVVKQFDANGEAIKGDREIDEVQADIIRRIFREYGIENKSPKAIAAQLNEENIPCPSGKSWGQSTINGNRKRGTGILNNELYIGRLIWNRQRFIKDPATGKRVTRLNDPSEWIIQDVPEQRIVDSELWEAVKTRQKTLDRKSTALWQTNRPQYLLSGLTKCGVCGGGYSKINSTQYGCSAAKNKGDSVCDNRRTIKREALEGYVLDGLQGHLMREELINVFCKEYTKHLSILHAQANAQRKSLESQRDSLLKERERLIQAIKDGIPASMVKDDLESVSERIEKAEQALTVQPALKPLIHPAMASRYHQAIKDLKASLNADGARAEASQHLRGLIDKVVLTPEEGEKGLRIDLYGDLAGILNMSLETKDMKILDKLCLNASNDNKAINGAFAHIDRIGSGGWI
ncbi:recombinase family protein [Aurantivibrio plasticivorans]